jgi:integrase
MAERGLKAYGTAERLRRLRAFFIDQEAQLVDLTRARCQRYYDALRAAVSSATKRPYSVDTCRNTLAEARMLLKFAIGKSWLRRSPLDGVEAHGKRRHGKEQLRLDEARRWLGKAVELAAAGDAGAVAAMMALLLGMRASEIVSRVVRDLDDDGKVLVIPESKTRAGRRQLQIPDLLQPHLQRLAANKPPEARIFGSHWRDWIRKSVRRVCELAEVPMVCAHSMRGLNASLAVAAGATGHLVAASLGHESQTTTFQSYADPAAVAGAQQRRALRVLAGGAG